MARIFLFLGAINAFLSVALGAFGAHALRGRLTPEMLDIYHTSVQYQIFHAIGLIVIGILALHFPNSGLLRWSGWLMFFGIVVFSGSLYVLAVTGVTWLGAITPIGGTAFLVSWLLLAIMALKVVS